MAIAAMVAVAALPFELSALNKPSGSTPAPCSSCALASVAIAPSRAYLGFGQHELFSAVAFNRSGALITPSVSFTWSLNRPALGALNSTSGPTTDLVSGSVNVTGNLSVTAISNGISKTAVANVTVQEGTSLCTVPGGQTLSGAGSTLVAPLMIAWSLAYATSTVDYSSVGSGAGINDITQKTVDFGATDAPLDPPQRAAIPAPGVLTFPESTGGVVPIYNVPGVSEPLRFTGQVLAAIYLGDITRWNNTAIQAINPGVALPNASIVVVHRSDGSGTTFVWSSFLADSNTTWNRTLGHSITIDWPVGVAEKGNAGVASTVQNTVDSIGYVDINYALTDGIAYGAVQNPTGAYVLANITNIESAIKDSNVVLPSPTGNWYNVSVLNAPGKEDYPVATFTYLLVYTDLSVAYGSSITLDHAKALVDFLSWVVSSTGQAYAGPLFYASLPAYVMTFDAAAIASITFNGGSLGVCTL